MDPLTIGKGAEALGKELGVVEKTSSPLNSPSQESPPLFSETSSIASSSDSFSLKRKREKEVFEEARVRKQLKEYEDAEAIQQPQATIVYVSPEAQQAITARRQEGEAAFLRAREVKSESAWNEAKKIALAISNDWNGIVGEIKTGINSLVMSQKEAAMQRDYWRFKADIAEIKALNEAPWPESICYSKSENRGEEMNMIIRYKIWPIVSEMMNLFIQYPSEEKMLAMRQVASDVTSVSSDSFGFTGATGENREASYIVATTFAFTALSTSTFGSASEVFEAVSMVNDLANEAKEEFNKMKDFQYWWLRDEEDHLNWVVSVACETEGFLRAVAQYKAEQETTIAEGNGQAKIEDANQELATVAREVFTVATMRDIQEPLKEKKANVLKKMICKKFGLPVSNIMQEFMAHPSEATLRATNNPFLVAMTATEAEETMEIIKIARCDGIIYDYFTKEQNEKLKFAQLLEFFRAIAKFKREQEAAT
ncbi:MAG: hypothetical protein A3F67_10800 [Verrucomicrobia bacterium RIFCSPHIGHO2_12_FULL_41_10]|nr:MAG: hypothetical protein A3F67_10800 [Verrucomicrobia bacterium RIFCSPHIGHO2_12_FULL_41_10]